MKIAYVIAGFIFGLLFGILITMPEAKRKLREAEDIYEQSKRLREDAAESLKTAREELEHTKNLIHGTLNGTGTGMDI